MMSAFAAQVYHRSDEVNEGKRVCLITNALTKESINSNVVLQRMTPMKADHQLQHNQTVPLQTIEQNAFTQFTTDEDTSGYLSDSRISPDAWNLEMDRSRPRLRLPNENRARIMHAKRQQTNQDNASHLSTEHHKKHKHYIETQLLTHSDPYQSDSTSHSVHNINGKHDTSKNPMALNGGQERKLLSDEMDGNEHESGFNMLKYVCYDSSNLENALPLFARKRIDNFRK